MFGCYATGLQSRHYTSASSSTRVEADMAERNSVNTIQREVAGRVRGLKPGHLTCGVTEFPKLHSSTALISFHPLPQPPKRTLQLQQCNLTTVRSASRCALRLRYLDLVVSIEVTVEVCCCLTVFSC
jgi:hypothetical protein